MRAMLAAVGAASHRRAVRRDPRGGAPRRPLALPAGVAEGELFGSCGAWPARSQPASAPGRASSAPASTTTTCRRSLTPSSSRSEFAHRLHALPAGAQPGRAADHLRVPDGDLRAHRHGRQQRLAVRRRHGAGRGRRSWPARRRGAAASSSRPACTPSTVRCWPPRRHGYGPRPADRGACGGRGSPTWRRSAAAVDDDTAAVVVQQPNFFGAPRGPGRRRRARARRPAPCSWWSPTRSRWACSRRRASYGADIVVGEAQSLGSCHDLRRPGPGLHGRRRAADAPHARPPRRRDRRRRGQARLRAHAADARAAHPPREGHQQHLLQPRSQRAGGARLPELAGPARASPSWACSARARPPTCASGCSALPGVAAVHRGARVPRVRRAAAACRRPSSSSALVPQGYLAGVPTAGPPLGYRGELWRTCCSWPSPRSARAPRSTPSSTRWRRPRGPGEAP